MKTRNHKYGLLKLAGAVLLTAMLAGCSSQGVTQAQATDIAFEHAGVTQEDAGSLSVSQDRENGVDVYEIEFSTEDRTYHYDISKKNGEVVNYSYQDAATAQTDGKTQSSQKEESASTSSKTTSGEKTTSSTAGSAVTEEEAKAIALEHAGLTEGDVTFHRVEQDYDDGKAVYEVEFYSGSTEYDYEIAKDTGKVVSYDSDIEGWAAASQQSGTTKAVTLEEASQLVLDRIPGAMESDVHIKSERDDGRDIYEGEAFYDGAKYEFEIDASTGNFIEWSVDYLD